MESELAKTLRAMSDDHRMVPDFSEKLLDIADAIERQAKELSQHRSELRGAHDAMEALAKALTKTEQERDAALAEVERLKAQNVAYLAETVRLRGKLLRPAPEVDWTTGSERV